MSMSEWSDNIKIRFLIFTVNIDYIFVINFWRKSIFQPQEPRNRDWEKAVNYFSFHCWISGVINDDVQTFNVLWKFRSSPSQSGWRSRSEVVVPPPSGPQVGSVHKSAQLIWAACPPYWHGWSYWHAMTKTCQNVGTLGEMSAPYAECRRLPTFWPFLQRKVKNLTWLKSVLSLPFKFVQNHKSRPISAMSLLGL